MINTQLDDSALSPGAKAVPYRPAADGFEPIPQLDSSCKFGGGGFLSSALDLARFGRAIYSGVLLTPEWLEIAATPASLPNGDLDGEGLRVAATQVAYLFAGLDVSKQQPALPPPYRRFR